ncbi:hypothetical protein AB0J86_19625 [Micromonospora sp. NPDC049559]|uniref:hypothetical protein n=1 Tax=Micromonospora sp. NPDC049559 TaxID=3155923 RepID=UPI003424DB6B
MARSAEHDFVTEKFIETASELSRSELYGYKEADRGLFDFAATLTANNQRQLVGQTLTHHAAGIDKDLSALLFESKSNLPIYLYSHDARNEARVQEFLQRASEQLPDRTRLVRLIRYPAFDADQEEERLAVAAAIRSQILDDLLLNVLFGRLTASDVDLFLQGTGIPGLLLAALENIASHGFINFPTLARPLGMKPSTLRSRVQSLLTAGMLTQQVGASVFSATPRAAIFLRACRLLARHPVISGELAFILQRLGLWEGTANPPTPTSLEELLTIPYTPIKKRQKLLFEIQSATIQFGVSFANESYLVTDPTREDNWVGR